MLAPKFIYDRSKDNTLFLSQLSPYLDADRTGDLSGVDPEEFAAMTPGDRNSLYDEACKAYSPAIEQATRYRFRNAPEYARQYMDDYRQELHCYVHADIHRFNNPKYADGEYNINTFVDYHAANVAKKMFAFILGMDEESLKMRKHIERIIEALTGREGNNERYIDYKMIYENQQLANDSMKMNEEQVYQVYTSMCNKHISWDDVLVENCEPKDEKCSGVIYRDVVDSFRPFFESLKDFEKHIYIKSLYLRDVRKKDIRDDADKSMVISMKEISSDANLVAMCKKQRGVRQYVLKRRDELKKNRHHYLVTYSEGEYVSISFINKTIERLDDLVWKAFNKLGLSPEERCMCIDYMMGLDWNCA